MLEIAIPGAGPLRLSYLVADYNGTLAQDGALLPDVAETLRTLAADLEIHVLTADTFGRARAELAGLPCRVVILGPGAQDRAKEDYLRALDAEHCVAIGNGRNDRLMLAAAALGIVVVQGEGADVQTLLAADVVVPDILTALGLLQAPQRLVATRRT
ncbi:HAD family hydrolase [Thermochromatium tepidum]|uniref:ATPase P n=1 Tax=Thermochromatium tepidum ATCC 43061 TaxID=316276 RepID=A0A6I6E9V2_THETI|nr:HAD family hydrolase [Thermochromatium tepidum]QGU31709.1 ATPase P [Thermochromatium tepidum ATCC 43061]